MRATLLLLSLSLAACNSTATTGFSNLEPLESLESIEIETKGAFSTEGLQIGRASCRERV